MAASDFVYRPETAFSGSFCSKISWGASVEPEISNHAQQISCISIVGGISWSPTSYLSLTPQLLYAAKGTDANSNEIRPRLSVELNKKISAIKFAWRNRFEYRMKEDKDEYWRYRSRIKVKLPKYNNLSPYFYNEIYYELGDVDEYSHNAAGIGVGIPLKGNVSLKVDFQLNHSRGVDKWEKGDLHLITVLKLSL